MKQMIVTDHRTHLTNNRTLLIIHIFQHWQVQKMITAIASLILFLAWLLSVILRPRGSNHVFDLYIATYGIGSLSVLLPILALFDAPRKFGFIWQITVMATSWTWSIGTLSGE